MSATATVPSGVVSTGLTAFKSVLSLVEKASEASPILGPIQAAAGGLLIVLESVEQERDVQESFGAAADKIGKILQVLKKYLSQPSRSPDEVQECTGEIASKMKQLGACLEKKRERSRLRRIILASADNREVTRCLREVADAVDIFLIRINVNQDAKVDNLISNSVNQGEKLDEILQSLLLAKLSPVRSARYDAMDIPSCSEKTRVQLLEDILAWAAPREGKDVPPVFLLSGVAGSGKSTIAKSVCAKLQDMGILGASFFCSRRSTAEQRDVRTIFPTLAYLLSLYSVKFATEVREALKNHPDAAAAVPEEQFRVLIDIPAMAAFTTADVAPVVVIDAVDECVGADAAYDLLEIILRAAPQLHLKFFVTSRPEVRIRDVFGMPGSTTLRLQDIESEAVDADIGEYITSELSGLDDDWPSPSDINTLVSRSHGLFIYAATACKYVTYYSGDPRARLQKLVSLHGQPPADMDAIYDLIVDQAQLDLDEEEVDAVRRCLTAVACVRDPLSVHDFAYFLNLTPRKVRIAFVALYSVVDVPESDDDLLTTYHASFPEYLTSSTRSRSKVAVPEDIHRALFDRCFEIMNSGLFFNVSCCKTSYASNSEQPRRQELLARLVYACRFWIEHLTMSSCSVQSAIEKVVPFLRDRFLYWLEVLSAINHASNASSLLMRLVVWFRANASANDAESVATCLRVLLDANQFVIRFRAPILYSIPHIYISALAFAPPDSEITRVWQGQLERRLQVHTKQSLEVLPLLTLHGHESPVRQLAFSPDGRRIASASTDGIIRFWDTGTGDAIGQPVQGPIRSVRSLVFSPDGTRVAAAAFNNYSLLIWDTETGNTVGEPLQGHTDDVNSISFSPNGELIASASSDRTIRVWDARPGTGASVSRPPMRHQDWVTAVVFSPDGAHIVSGSSGGMLCLWNAETCDATGTQFIGHRGHTVMSVAFSADGKYVVSTSMDDTIRLWNVETGTVVGQWELRGQTSNAVFSPSGKLIASSSADTTVHVWNVETECRFQALKGHTDCVCSVVFSPDGGLIASASDDKTVCIWDTQISSEDTQPLERHTGAVWSVTFSPDGRHVVSGSKDKTVHVWDAETGSAVTPSLDGHDGEVNSVAISPDGLKIASGSDDKTIRLWSMATGAPVGQPLKGHLYSVQSIAFSPDGRRITSGSSDNTIRVWDALTGTAIGEPFTGHDDDVTSVAYSPDGRLIVSGSDDKTVRVRDAKTGASVGQPLKGHTDVVTSVAFSPDGKKIASGSEDKTIQIWNIQIGGTAVGQPLRGQTDEVWSLAFSPDGRHVVSASDSDDKTIRVWSVETCAAVGWPLKGHTNSVTSAVFSPDGTHIASGSRDKTVRIWDASFRADSAHRAVDEAPHHGPLVSFPDDFSGPANAFHLTEDGWILGPQGELFLWIPPEYRPGLWWPRTTAIIGVHPVHLDLSRFAHGTAWSECWSSNSHRDVAR
ncbi:WD40 repeat-like protein [Daedalea quercina L-15889]|uniref:WD40 repeat-like protein n=1 Tax=Daedalea quercina L-15889 TaxID=1314783 RepID=A0A165PXA5_9APHY|nr:WD40 repeat-like protein [Daedalea quercina L-15889]